MVGEKVVETERLILRLLSVINAEFIFELVNDPAWLQYIGDKGVRTLDDARDYILKGPVAMYARCGFGLYLVELKDGSVPIGICGLIRRDTLDDVDLGFAFLPQFRMHGYAQEAAAATLTYGRNTLGLKRIVAITTPDNQPSVRLLDRLGFQYEKAISAPEGSAELSLFASEAAI